MSTIPSQSRRRSSPIATVSESNNSKNVPDMPTCQNERVKMRNGMEVTNCKCEFSSCYNDRRINRTERASRT
jgi:hypothetical protein